MTNGVKLMKKNLILAILLVTLVVVSRLVPHVWNVTPIMAVSLLVGAVLPRRWAFVVPLVAMLVSDVIIGFYDVGVMLTVYASFSVVALLGVWLRNLQPSRILVGSLASSTLFFLTTNFAVWATADWYSKTWSGLMLAYELGLPFFRNMALGDVVYTGVLFGTWAVVQNYVKSATLAKVAPVGVQ